MDWPSEPGDCARLVAKLSAGPWYRSENGYVAHLLRPAQDNDAPSLMRLRQAYLVEQVLDLRAGAIAEWLSHDEAWWAGFIGHAAHSSDQLLVVAEMDDVVVGMARVAIDSDNHELSHFGMLYVEAPARGQGLGRELLGTRESWARDRGALMGEAWITVGQTVSEELHRRAGWSESGEIREASVRSTEQIWRIEW